jgi:hypothetical protein
MGIPTGEELLESLRDGRQPFIDGDRVKDVTTDPRLVAAAAGPRSALRHVRAAWAASYVPSLAAQRVHRAPAGSIRGWTGLS